MTRLILAASLVLTPGPFGQRPQETHPWPVSPLSVTSAVKEPTTSPWSIQMDWPIEPIFGAPIESPALTVSLSPPVELAPIERGMNRLAELGASPYQLRVFGCLAWAESKNDPYAVSATNDRGLWQIHFPLHAWRSAGRDIFDPVVNAEVAWSIYRESGFRAWSTHGLCNV